MVTTLRRVRALVTDDDRTATDIETRLRGRPFHCARDAPPTESACRECRTVTASVSCERNKCLRTKNRRKPKPNERDVRDGNNPFTRNACEYPKVETLREKLQFYVFVNALKT